jgi:anti-sigma regulatory factor (Ser/Thr protein kinase)
MGSEIRHLLRPRPAAAAEAREALSPLEGRISDETLEDLRLVVSELVTNSVRHAKLEAEDLIELKVTLGPQKIRLEVTDAGPGFESGFATPGPEQTSGWGLYVVDRLASRWGVSRDDATRVWVELEPARRSPDRDPGRYPGSLMVLGCLLLLPSA